MGLGEVAVTVRLMPESADVDIDRLEADVRARVRVHSIEREPIAFGLEALRIVAVVPDAAGGTDPLEEALSSIPGVGNVQVIDVRRLL
jgi:elongation factor 1-beta